MNLVIVLLCLDHPDHALGVPNHVIAALAPPLLLCDRYVAHLARVDVGEGPDLQVLQALADLGAVHQFQLLADCWLAIERVHLVVVSLHDAIVVGHAHVRDQI